jgi:hypothetical protein
VGPFLFSAISDQGVSRTWEWTDGASGGASFVPMMQAADFRERDDPTFY